MWSNAATCPNELFFSDNNATTALDPWKNQAGADFARNTGLLQTDNTLIGVAVKAVGGTAGETTGTVRLNGSF